MADTPDARWALTPPAAQRVRLPVLASRPSTAGEAVADADF